MQPDKNLPLKSLLLEAKTSGRLLGQLKFDESMSRYTTWRIGGHAECFYQPESVEDLQALFKLLPANTPVYWLGLGSNLLIRDGGLKGIVINTCGTLNDLSINCHELNDSCLITAQVGLACAVFSRKVAHEGINGAEFLSGIPGTIGGALAMNAGAFGSETWSFVKAVKMINRQGEIMHKTPDDFNIQYRHIELKNSAEQPCQDSNGQVQQWFISADFLLNKDEQGLLESKQKIKQLLAKRAATQPTRQANAGSVFKNPENDYAARLIELCGLKGESINDAQVSEKHANFIINNGNATANDVETLIKKIQQTVFEQCHVQLETEVCVIGQY